MKNKTVLLVFVVLLCNLLAGYMVLSQVGGEDKDKAYYDSVVASADKYAKDGLYKKAVSSYSEAVSLNDSIELRMKMVDTFQKGYENGEFESLDYKYQQLTDNITAFPTQTQSYDILLDNYFAQQNYEECVNYIKLAKKNNVSDDKIKDYYNKLRKMYSSVSYSFENLVYLGDAYMGSSPLDDGSGQQRYNFIDAQKNGSEYNAVTMSPISYVSVSEDVAYPVWFESNYGNSEETQTDTTADEVEIDKGELYSAVYINGVRQFYLDNKCEVDYGYCNDLLKVYDTDTKLYCYYNYNGEVVLKDYTDAGNFSNQVAYVEKDGKKQIIDKNGKSLFDKEIDDVILNSTKRCSVANRMFIKFVGDDFYKMINTEDLSEISGFTCTNAYLFSAGNTAFEQDGKWGFADLDGKTVIPPQYEKAKSFSNGLAAVMQGDKWGYINTDNEMVIEPQFDNASYFTSGGYAFTYSNETLCWNLITMYYWENRE